MRKWKKIECWSFFPNLFVVSAVFSWKGVGNVNISACRYLVNVIRKLLEIVEVKWVEIWMFLSKFYLFCPIYLYFYSLSHLTFCCCFWQRTSENLLEKGTETWGRNPWCPKKVTCWGKKKKKKKWWETLKAKSWREMCFVPVAEVTAQVTASENCRHSFLLHPHFCRTWRLFNF